MKTCTGQKASGSRMNQGAAHARFEVGWEHLSKKTKAAIPRFQTAVETMPGVYRQMRFFLRKPQSVWRGGINGGVRLPVGTSSLTHFVVFCERVRPGCIWPVVWRCSVSAARGASGFAFVRALPSLSQTRRPTVEWAAGVVHQLASPDEGLCSRRCLID